MKWCSVVSAVTKALKTKCLRDRNFKKPLRLLCTANSKDIEFNTLTTQVINFIKKMKSLKIPHQNCIGVTNTEFKNESGG